MKVFVIKPIFVPRTTMLWDITKYRAFLALDKLLDKLGAVVLDLHDLSSEILEPEAVIRLRNLYEKFIDITLNIREHSRNWFSEDGQYDVSGDICVISDCIYDLKLAILNSATSHACQDFREEHILLIAAWHLSRICRALNHIRETSGIGYIRETSGVGSSLIYYVIGSFTDIQIWEDQIYTSLAALDRAIEHLCEWNHTAKALLYRDIHPSFLNPSSLVCLWAGSDSVISSPRAQETAVLYSILSVLEKESMPAAEETTRVYRDRPLFWTHRFSRRDAVPLRIDCVKTLYSSIVPAWMYYEANSSSLLVEPNSSVVLKKLQDRYTGLKASIDRIHIAGALQSESKSGPARNCGILLLKTAIGSAGKSPIVHLLANVKSQQDGSWIAKPAHGQIAFLLPQTNRDGNAITICDRFSGLLMKSAGCGNAKETIDLSTGLMRKPDGGRGAKVIDWISGLMQKLIGSRNAKALIVWFPGLMQMPVRSGNAKALIVWFPGLMQKPDGSRYAKTIIDWSEILMRISDRSGTAEAIIDWSPGLMQKPDRSRIAKTIIVWPAGLMLQLDDHRKAKGKCRNNATRRLLCRI